MLNAFRKNTKLIIWIVVIAFAVGGGVVFGTSFKSKESRMAGEVFGKAVSFQDFRSFYHGARITGEPIQDPQLLHQKTWQNIVYSREAHNRKIDVSDEEVKRELSSLLRQVNLETATPEAYEKWLQSTFKLSTRDFEEQIRELIRIRKLVTSVLSAPSENVDEEKVRQKFLLDHTKVKADMIVLETEEAAAEVAASDTAAWQKAMNAEGAVAESGIEATMLDLAVMTQLSVKNAEMLTELSAGSISQPMQTPQGYAVFRIIEKQDADFSELDGEMKQAYLEELQQNERQIRFLIWTQDLLKRAQVKDYVASAQQ